MSALRISSLAALIEIARRSLGIPPPRVFDPLNMSRGGNRYIALGMSSLAVAHDPYRMNDVVEIIQGLSHAHEHDIVNVTLITNRAA